MKILMTTERLLSDGSKLESFTETNHGWPSIKEGTDALCKRWGKCVERLPNGFIDRAFDKATGIKQRVTFSEVA